MQFLQHPLLCISNCLWFTQCQCYKYFIRKCCSCCSRNTQYRIYSGQLYLNSSNNTSSVFVCDVYSSCLLLAVASTISRKDHLQVGKVPETAPLPRALSCTLYCSISLLDWLAVACTCFSVSDFLLKLFSQSTCRSLGHNLYY